MVPEAEGHGTDVSSVAGEGHMVHVAFVDGRESDRREPEASPALHIGT